MKKGVKILILCMALLIVGLITFIVVDKVINNKDKNNDVANATTNKSNTVINETAETKDDNKEKEDKEKEDKKTTDKGNDEVAKVIAEALKERRFMAKNGIDIESDAKFIKVADNIYLIRVTDKSQDVAMTTDFVVRYEDGQAVFEKLEIEKHPYDLSVDIDHHIVKAERTMKGYTSTKFYDLSNGKFELKLEFGAPYKEGDIDYSDTYKYTIDGEEVSEETYKTRFNSTQYNSFNYITFEGNSRIFDDKIIDDYVK